MSTVEFQSQVLKDFQKKQAEGRLSFAFPKPTPAKIKTACQETLETRFEKRDERFLCSYFKPTNGQDLQLAVNKFDRDKFKPLNYYLQDPSKNPRFEQIQLLAWLIDFPDRPYQTSYERVTGSNDNGVVKTEGQDPSADESKSQSSNSDPLEGEPTETIQDGVKSGDTQLDETEPDKEPKAVENATAENATVGGQKKTGWNKRQVYSMVIGAFMLASIVVWIGGSYDQKRRSLIAIPVNGQNGCAIWDGDHYQSVSCNQQAKGFANFGLDARTVRDLRKITLPDTITTKGLKHVWYVKIGDQLEYYTAAGFHPIHTDLRLRPLTTYIYNKYLFRYDDKTKDQLSLFNAFK